MSHGGALTFVFDHFEKAALAVAVLALALVAARFLGPPPLGRYDLERMQRQIADIDAYVEQPVPPLPPLTDAPAALRRSLTTTPAARQLPTWLMHRRPLFLTRERQVDVPDVVHGAPAGLAADTARRDRIALRWKASGEDALVRLRPYEVQRAEADPDAPRGPLAWKTVGKVDPDAPLAFVDRTVRPGRAYRYRVVSIAAVDSAAPAVREYGLRLDSKQARTRTGVVGPFVPKPRVYLRLQGGQPGQRAALAFHGAGVDLSRFPRVGRATLRVWVWSPDGFRTATLFEVREGAPIHKTKGRGAKRRVVLETGFVLRRVFLVRVDVPQGDRTYQVTQVRAEVEGPDGGRKTLAERQAPPAEVARRP